MAEKMPAIRFAAGGKDLCRDSVRIAASDTPTFIALPRAKTNAGGQASEWRATAIPGRIQGGKLPDLTDALRITLRFR